MLLLLQETYLNSEYMYEIMNKMDKKPIIYFLNIQQW